MLSQIKQNALKKIEEAKDLKNLEAVYKKYLGRQGELTKVLRSLKDLPEKERQKKGKLANQVKQGINGLIKERRNKFQFSSGQNNLAAGQANSKFQNKDWIDVTAPGHLPPSGHIHPISLIQRQTEEIFQSMGFSIINGPELETEYYNFDALNIPQNHPARDLWDTFWLKDLPNLVLRTHTSPMQARYMEKNSPPLRIIVPGRCFRHEATDASHDVQFYQVEGLMVGPDVSVADFKGVIKEFLKELLGPSVKMRLRPSYFPFTEPSFEIDVAGSEISRRKGEKWMEIMGAGMVHPNVFKAVGYLPDKWQGFAFGLGLERVAMIKYNIDDIRLFYSGDLKFLNQF